MTLLNCVIQLPARPAPRAESRPAPTSRHATVLAATTIKETYALR